MSADSSYNRSSHQVTVESLWGNKRRRSSKPVKGRGLRAGTNLTPEITEKLGLAENHYIAGNHAEAIKELSEISKIAPKLSYVYSMLALIYEESGYTSYALQLYALAAAYHSRDLDSWHKVAHVGIEQREYEQALTALYRCCKLSHSKYVKAQKTRAARARKGEVEEEEEEDNDDADTGKSKKTVGFQALSARNKFKHNDDSDYQQYSKLRLMLLIKTGKFSTFRDSVKPYIQSFPDDVRIFCDLGQCFFEEGYDRFAVEYFQKFLEYYLLTLIQQNYSLSTLQTNSTSQSASSSSTASFLAVRSFNHTATRDALETLSINIFDVFFATRQLSVLLFETFNEYGEVVELIENLFTIFHQLKTAEPMIVGVRDLEFPMDLLLMLGLNKLKAARIDVEVDAAMKILQPALTSIMTYPENFFSIINNNHNNDAMEVEDELPLIDKRVLEDQLFVLYEIILIAEGLESHGVKTRAQKMFAFAADILHKLINNDMVYDAFVQILSGAVVSSAAALGDESTAASTANMSEQVSFRIIKKFFAELLNSTMFASIPTSPSVDSIADILRNASDNDASSAQLLNHYASCVITRYLPADDRFCDLIQKMKFFDELARYFFFNLARKNVKSNDNDQNKDASADAEANIVEDLDKEKFNENEKDDEIDEDELTAHQSLLKMKNEAALPVLDDEDEEEDEDEEVAEQELEQVYQHALDPLSNHSMAEVTNATEGNSSGPTKNSFLAGDEISSALSPEQLQIQQELQEKVKSTTFVELQGRPFVSRLVAKEILVAIHQYTLLLFKKLQSQLKSLISTGTNAEAASYEYSQEVSTFLTLVFAWFHCYKRIPILRLKTRERIQLESIASHMKKYCDKLIALSAFEVNGSFTSSVANDVSMDPAVRAALDAMDVDEIMGQDSSGTKRVLESYHWMRRKDQELYSLVVVLCEYFPVEEFVTKELLKSYSRKATEILREHSLETEATLLEDMEKIVSTMKISDIPGVSGTGGIAGVAGYQYSSNSGFKLASEQANNKTPLPSDSQGIVLVMNSAPTKGTSRKLNRLFYHQRKFIRSAEQINEECKTIAETITMLYNDLCKVIYEQRKASMKVKTNPVTQGAIDQQTTVSIGRLEKEMIYQTNLFTQLLHQQFHAGKSDESNVNTVLSTMTSKYIENRLPIRNMFGEGQLKDVKTVMIELLLGHEWAIFKRHAEVVDHYLNAYILDPQQPLTTLCVATYLLMLAGHHLTKNRVDILNKAFAFFLHYQHLRRTVPSPQLETNEHFFILSEAAKLQETHYNFGRAFHEIDLPHLAMEQYQQALSMVDEYPDLLDVSNSETRLNVTRQAAFNLSLLYKKSKAPELAFEVMAKYLMF